MWNRLVFFEHQCFISLKPEAGPTKVMAGEAPGAASHAESPAIDEGPGIDEAEFADAYDSVRLKPCKVSRVVVRGLRRTRLGVVRQELDKVMQAGNLEEIKDALVEAYADLMGLGAFDAVELVVDEGGKVGACMPALVSPNQLLTQQAAPLPAGTGQLQCPRYLQREQPAASAHRHIRPGHRR